MRFLTHNFCLAILFSPPFAFETAMDPTYPTVLFLLPTLLYSKLHPLSLTFDLAPCTLICTANVVATVGVSIWRTYLRLGPLG
ncbi:hypothetical protein EDD15DRAFT_2316772 [Pisolithus albus]|nr:hypothetical protein EDD15DRAFT_2316772 [Pisolithus albus]